MKPRGIVVSVGFDDLLAITLPKNMRFLESCLVVTSLDDERTKAVARSNGVEVLETDAFFRHGAKFNKSLGLEEGFDRLVRAGWIHVWDADTLFPDCMTLPELKIGTLYGAPRRFVMDPRKWNPSIDWRLYDLVPDANRCSGYFQLFHAMDEHIAARPWYDVTFSHAGGGDGYFDQRWPRSHVQRLPFHVLHLGPWCSSWFGRTYERLDGEPLPETAAESKELIEQYKANKNWNGTTREYCEFNERVTVPGATPSNFAPRPWNGPRRGQ